MATQTKPDQTYPMETINIRESRTHLSRIVE